MMRLDGTQTPSSLGYRMPAEWEPHAATWLAWPHNATDWPGKFQPIPWVFCEIVRHLSQGEEVHILADDLAMQKRAEGQLARAGCRLDPVHFHLWPTNRIWTRDSGPIFIKKPAQSRSIAAGDDEPASPSPSPIGSSTPGQSTTTGNTTTGFPLGLRNFSACPFGRRPSLCDGRLHPVVLEGGSIDVNGAGTLITTEECLLSDAQQRNPGLDREGLERIFHDYLGIDQVLWMNRGIAGDDTHGHVDDITRFVAPDTIVTVTEPNTDDENHLPLAENLERLRAARNLEGEPYRIVELPMPAPVVFQGQRLPASYANFYIANGRVLVPTFNDPNDRKALNAIAELFPGRQVAGIHCGDLVWGLGTLHCMTQQQPAE